MENANPDKLYHQAPADGLACQGGITKSYFGIKSFFGVKLNHDIVTHTCLFFLAPIYYYLQSYHHVQFIISSLRVPRYFMTRLNPFSRGFAMDTAYHGGSYQ